MELWRGEGGSIRPFFILRVKSKLPCGRFAPLRNFVILLLKISVGLILSSFNLIM